ncbi:MAG TPA: alpha/beta fold hydrolase [Geminicoccaceae bacterium]|nr:alpha/beta fold hydrolase [Geminicoccaceae bacterium]
MERRLAAIMATDMAGYSRLMEVDEEGVLVRQKVHRRELIDPEISAANGRIVKSTGDGLLVEFGNVVDAVRCAVTIQSAMPRREAGIPHDRQILYRVGINLGDILFEEGDVFGDAVNVAARLEGLSVPGGVCVSDVVHQLIDERIDAPFRNLGSQRVKNISRPVRVWQWTPDAPATEAIHDATPLNQEVRFCTAPDGVQIACSSVGEGPPLFKAPNWLNHIEYEWRSPVWGPFLRELARHYRLVRFDQRGNGLSDWDVEEISEDVMISDMATVADAMGLERFALLGISQGCAFSIRYAFENRERVSCLVLLGGFVRGRLMRRSAEQEEMFRAATTMIRHGWGSTNPAIRHFFTETFMPDATPEQKRSFDELQRITTTAENAERIWHMNASVEVSELARQVQAPTLAVHCRDDPNVPLAEGRRMAGLLPGARFVELEGANHVVIEGTPAFDQFFSEVRSFLARHAA